VLYDNKPKSPKGFAPRQYGFTKPGEKAAEVVVNKKQGDKVAEDAMPKKKKKKKKKHSAFDDQD